MRVYRGIPVSPGVSIGPAFVLRSRDSLPPMRTIAMEEIEAELERFHAAVEAARAELDQTASKVGLAEPIRSIAGSHRELLADPTLVSEIEGDIRNRQSAAESAVASVFQRWVE